MRIIPQIDTIAEFLASQALEVPLWEPWKLLVLFTELS